MGWRLHAADPVPVEIPFDKDSVRREMIVGVLNNFPEWRIVPLGVQEELESPFDLFLVKPVIKVVKTTYGKDSCTPQEFIKPEKLQICAAVFIRKTQIELPLEVRADLQQWINHLWVCKTGVQLMQKLSQIQNEVS